MWLALQSQGISVPHGITRLITSRMISFTSRFQFLSLYICIKVVINDDLNLLWMWLVSEVNRGKVSDRIFFFFVFFKPLPYLERTCLFKGGFCTRSMMFSRERRIMLSYSINWELKFCLSRKMSFFFPFPRKKCIIPNNRLVGCTKNVNNFLFSYKILSILERTSKD